MAQNNNSSCKPHDIYRFFGCSRSSKKQIFKNKQILDQKLMHLIVVGNMQRLNDFLSHTIEYQTDFNIREIIFDSGFSPLTLASRVGNITIANIFISKYNFDVNICDESINRGNALHHAAMKY